MLDQTREDPGDSKHPKEDDREYWGSPWTEHSSRVTLFVSSLWSTRDPSVGASSDVEPSGLRYDPTLLVSPFTP